MQNFLRLWHDSGIYHLDLGQAAMMLVGLLLLFLAIRKGFEPLLLVPIGFGCILSNIPGAGLSMSAVENALASGYPDVIGPIAQLLGEQADAGIKVIAQAYKHASAGVQADANRLAADLGYANGMLYNFYSIAIGTGVAPLLIFMGVGAMTDFGPLLANPKTLFLGAAAQFGIFATVMGAVGLSVTGIIDFSIADAAAIGIIGGADGPTAIYVASILSPELLGAIAVAAYSYMALVPMIQPPIMRLLTNEKERQIKMEQMRTVSRREKIVFPLILLIMVALILPSAAPLLGMFCFGNLMRECGVVERLSDTAQNALINIVTIFLGLSVGSKLAADKFLDPKTLGILVLGIVAFGIGTAMGVLTAKFMNLFVKHKINPLIGSAGVSAVPMAARVSNKLGLEANPQNYLLMHAMGPNVAGVIGSAIAAGVMISIVSSLT
ncbi:sodium ion-translocating decarboxylase subunit beta [Gilvimarinus agarilyticus]|uniref:sodium ion-translocating decarboxylase subunit beta n=1 Tax=unclassified Gilvimarinus TaxID=2642066 RepID=UPI001C08F5CD|nr:MULTISPECIES: sodium ion-translocating decarboxylase subunit beta [unclassified Gilvimarinus]MBU2886828.1 sodium ion-translocating decarboxylase subunit beta [Gilvimarinus agarilyticus]MDO6571492.1 sodium ion-translocating decarboxylase subunit beta [Gilvimarinus sp. 2_MG-2023]MDO6747327.1 sodium ion-translocating decarboxylase subunit beta [Gilvimarinus sp. 1_MG-2023]